MEIFRTLAGWLLFLAMAIVAGFFWHQSAQRGVHIAALSDTIDQMESQMDQFTESVGAFEKQIDQAMETISLLRAELDRIRAADGKVEAEGAAMPVGATLGDMLDTLMQGGNDEEGDASVASAMVDMFKTPQGEKMLEAGINMTMNMQFSEFFDLFPPEDATAVREILGKFMIHSARLGVSFMDTGDMSDMDGAIAETIAARETMLTDLRNVIGDDGVAFFEQYEQELPGRMMDQALEMQLGMFARGLSDETKLLVRATLVEELLASQPSDLSTTPSMLQAHRVMEGQDAAYDRALERLAAQVTVEEYDVIEGFVHQQQQMMNMFGTMMLPEKPKE